MMAITTNNSMSVKAFFGAFTPGVDPPKFRLSLLDTSSRALFFVVDKICGLVVAFELVVEITGTVIWIYEFKLTQEGQACYRPFRRAWPFIRVYTGFCIEFRRPGGYG
jgi:hypothetical protein